VASARAALIARHEGTTRQELVANSNVKDLKHLHAGDMLHFHKAHMGREITGWLVFAPEIIMARYNRDSRTATRSGGDSWYAERMRYVLGKLNAEHPVGGGFGAAAIGGDSRSSTRR
jgi:hypothetical protein